MKINNRIGRIKLLGSRVYLLTNGTREVCFSARESLESINNSQYLKALVSRLFVIYKKILDRVYIYFQIALLYENKCMSPQFKLIMEDYIQLGGQPVLKWKL